MVFHYGAYWHFISNFIFYALSEPCAPFFFRSPMMEPNNECYVLISVLKKNIYKIVYIKYDLPIKNYQLPSSDRGWSK